MNEFRRVLISATQKIILDDPKARFVLNVSGNFQGLCEGKLGVLADFFDEVNLN